MCSKGRQCYLVHVHTLLESLLNKHNDPIYIADTPESFEKDPTINYQIFEDPYQELLLWAILSTRIDLAHYLWERCSSPLCSAIVSTGIYESMRETLGAKNTEMIQQYNVYKKTFEDLAINVS